MTRWWGVNTAPKGDLFGFSHGDLIAEVWRLRRLLNDAGVEW